MATTQRRMKPRLALAALVLAAVGLTSGCAAASTSSDPVAIPEPAPAATGALTQNDVDAWLDGMLPAALEEAGIAGATVSVVHDGSILTARGFGVSSVGSGSSPRRSVDPDRDLFRVGSISKLFSATAVMQLVERGDLELDADVNEYLDFDLAEPYGPITLRNLLTHTAGFEERVSGVFGPALFRSSRQMVAANGVGCQPAALKSARRSSAEMNWCRTSRPVISRPHDEDRAASEERRSMGVRVVPIELHRLSDLGPCSTGGITAGDGDPRHCEIFVRTDSSIGVEPALTSRICRTMRVSWSSSARVRATSSRAISP